MSPKVGNTKKDKRLRGDLKDCVPIEPAIRTFMYKQGNKDIEVERKQFPLDPAHAITIHKSQGQTLDYMTGDMDDSTLSKNPNRKNNVAPGQFYTLASRARSRDKLKILNFSEEKIKVNKLAVQEMERMRRESFLQFNHPLEELNGDIMCLLNIRSWNLHIKHFLSEKLHPTKSCMFCFTESHVKSTEPDVRIEDLLPDWKDIHSPTEHGLSICFNTEKVQVIQRYPSMTTLQILPILVKIGSETILVVLLYRPNGPCSTFFNELSIELGFLPTEQYRTLIVGDFNLDQHDPHNKSLLLPFLNDFKMTQRSQYSTHERGGVLDLVLDSANTTEVEIMPSQYSDHYILFINL